MIEDDPYTGLTEDGLKALLHALAQKRFETMRPDAKAVAVETAAKSVSNKKWVADNLTSRWGAQKFLDTADSEATRRGQAAEMEERKKLSGLSREEQDTVLIDRERAAAMERAQREEDTIRDRAMAGTAPVAVELTKAIKPPAIAMGRGLTFRAVGKRQPPWTLDGFTSLKAPMTVEQIVRSLYADSPGVTAYMGNFRAGVANNVRDYPFISAGPIVNDSQGASEGFWQYAIDAPALTEVIPAAIAAELGITILNEAAIKNCRLLTDTGRVRDARLACIEHGPLPEQTWITSVPKGRVIAFIRLGGEPWMQRWTSMTDAAQFQTICKKYDFTFD